MHWGGGRDINKINVASLSKMYGPNLSQESQREIKECGFGGECNKFLFWDSCQRGAGYSYVVMYCLKIFMNDSSTNL